LLLLLFLAAELATSFDFSLYTGFSTPGLIASGLVLGAFRARKKNKKPAVMARPRKRPSEKYEEEGDWAISNWAPRKRRRGTKTGVYTWRHRQTVSTNIVPSWRPRLWRQRTYYLLPIDDVHDWAKKKFWDVYDDALFVVRRWRGYHARYSYIKRMRFIFRTRVVPGLHYNIARIHRWPLLIVTSLFVIPVVSVPVPWFTEDYGIALQDLTQLYKYVHTGLVRNS
jgi:hypothetical protein